MCHYFVSTGVIYVLQVTEERRDGHRPRGYRVRVQRFSAEGSEPGSIPQRPNRARRGQDGDLCGCGPAAPPHLSGLRSRSFSW